MTSVSCLAKKLVPSMLECDVKMLIVFKYFGTIPALTDWVWSVPKTINQNVLGRFVRDVGILYYRSDAIVMIFRYCFFYFFDVIVTNRGERSTRLRQVFDDFTTLNKCFVPLKVRKTLWNVFNDSVAVTAKNYQAN